MGVRGLQTYIEKHVPGAFTEVSLPQMVHEFKLKNPDQKDVVIVVDGSNCARWLYGNTDWVCGGQWREFHEKIQNFVYAFQKIGIQLVFFFDGMHTCLNNFESWKYRRLQDFKEAAETFANIKQHKPVPDNVFVYPQCLEAALKISLMQMVGVTVYQNVFGACDKMIASYAKLNNCMAILAQDSDYLIYPTVPYISSQYLDLGRMVTVMYSREKLCEQIGLDIAMLPYFACLVGNGCIPQNNLKVFHTWVIETFSSRDLRYPRICIHISLLVPSVAKCLSYMLQNGGLHDLLSKILIKCPNMFDTSFTISNLIECLKDYELNYEQTRLFSPMGSAALVPQQKAQHTIDGVLEQKTIHLDITPILLEIVLFGVVEQYSTMEDECLGLFPLNTMLYRPIRQRLYHIILAFRDAIMKKGSLVAHTGLKVSCNDYVEEWHPISESKLAKVNVMPQTLKLTESEIKNSIYEFLTYDECDELKQKKWKVFTEVIGMTISLKTLLEIPDQFKALCITLNYIFQNHQVGLQSWEVETFVVQAVLLRDLDTKGYSNSEDSCLKLFHSLKLGIMEGTVYK